MERGKTQRPDFKSFPEGTVTYVPAKGSRETSQELTVLWTGRDW